MLADALQPHADGAVVDVRVRPRSQPTGLAGEQARRLVIRVGAPPVHGAANDAVLKLLAELLGVTRARIVLLQGERSRDKRLLIRGASVKQLAAQLAQVELR